MMIFKVFYFLWCLGVSVLASPRRVYKPSTLSAGVNGGVLYGVYGSNKNQLNNDSILCEGDNGDLGVCMYRDLCLGRKGMELGTCGESGVLNLKDGNVCCKFEASCDSIVSESVAYFQSPDYPEYQNDEVACNLQLNILPKVTQIRIDFLEFELPAPGPDGRCHPSNYFNVLSSQSPLGLLGGTQSQPLCGINTDNHIYLPVVEGEKIQLMFTVSGLLPVPLSSATNSLSSDLAIRWNLRIIQIEEDSTDEIASNFAAPDGCTQYYRASWGKIKSFNYDASSRFGPNQDYTICFDDKDSEDGKVCKVTLQTVGFGLPTQLVSTGREYYQSEPLQSYEMPFGPYSPGQTGPYSRGQIPPSGPYSPEINYPSRGPYSQGQTPTGPYNEVQTPPTGPYSSIQTPPGGPYAPEVQTPPGGPYSPEVHYPPVGPYSQQGETPSEGPYSSNQNWDCADGTHFAVNGQECCVGSDSSYIGIVQDKPLRYFFCGKKFANDMGLVDYTSKPFTMRVYSPNWGSNIVLDKAYVGFSFDYQLVGGLC